MRYFTSLKDFYKSKEWENFRELIIAERLDKNGNTIDEVTGLPIYAKYDIILHHKIELTMENVNDYSISLNPANIMIVSHKTHNEIHNRFGFYERKVYLVHGNICSGKSSFVRNVATKDDLILDVDNIWQMISVNERYEKPNRLKPVVFAVRECLMDQIKMRNGQWFSAYVITSSPYIMERKRLADKLGVSEIIHIDTPKEECLKNLYNDKHRKNVLQDYEKLINEYASAYQSE